MKIFHNVDEFLAIFMEEKNILYLYNNDKEKLIFYKAFITSLTNYFFINQNIDSQLISER